MTTTPSDLIQELLDGEIDSSMEVRLYAQLASNADLRQEFRQHLALRATVQRDRAALVPPLSLTSSVFSSLGFAAPLAGAAAGTAGGGLLLQWLTKFGLPLLSAATAAGITIAVSSDSPMAATSGTSTASTSIPGPADLAAEQSVATSVERTADETSVLRTELNQAQGTISALRSERSRLLQALAEQRQQHSEAPTARESEQPPTPLATVLPVMPIQEIRMSNALAVTASSDQRAYQPVPIEMATPSFMLYPSFMIQVRGLALQGLTPVTPKPDLSWYDNSSVAFLYQLSDKSTIGVEIGNEAFPQAFEHDRNGQTIQTEQYPTSTWGGLMYRHQFNPLISNVRPFVQALAGGTRFGPIGRLAGGIQYSPSGPLSFVAGIEGTVATYTVQNQWFGSTKLGFTYGVLVRL
jgi:hypothetical protein